MPFQSPPTRTRTISRFDNTDSAHRKGEADLGSVVELKRMKKEKEKKLNRRSSESGPRKDVLTNWMWIMEVIAMGTSGSLGRWIVTMTAI